MWSSDRRIVGAFILLASLALAGCFRPMYATLGETADSDGNSETIVPSLQQQLANIGIAPARDRVEQRIRNELIYAFNSGSGASIDYQLTMSVNEVVEDVIVRRTREPESQILVLNVRFALTELSSGKVVHGGNSVARASFDRSTEIFANERARLDAENRAARVVANSIKTRVAGYLASQS